ncbi:MAG TPA: integrin alpha, partial [Planctomycetota bacterium]|nr:integrin alpha [Planctomycetota bacterium]
AGRAYVLSGKDGALLATLQPPVGAGGGSPAGDSFGNQVRGLGDVDGDGHDDVAVSAPFHDGASGGAPDAGRVCVFSGKSGALLFALDGEREGDHFGTALGGATWPAASGAVGAREGLLLVGAMDAGEGQRGRVSVFRLLAGQAQAHFAIEAEPSGSNLGQFFASVVGDLDADGVPDVYATDFGDAALPGSTRGAAGRIVLHSGKDGRRLATIAGHSPGEGFGIGNAQAVAVHVAGLPDLIVGAWTNSDGAQRAGKAYVISGKDRATLATFTGALPGDEFGFDATGLGDVDGDGAPDFLVTAASSNDGGPKAGRVYVLSGAGIAAARASR